MFLCSLVGVIVISMMVVAVKNKLEMNGLETKAYTVINKVEIKKKVKLSAADVIGKAVKIYLKVKKHKNIAVSKVFDLNDSITNFKNLRR